jgi:tetratricopeptide (TPR) repeat protein
MLLNRERVKFWQKIVFGAMAALMAGFLIFGYSGVASSCRNTGVVQTGNSVLDKRLKEAAQTIKTNPKDAAALLQLAQGYQAAGNSQTDGSAQQADDLSKALTYYDRYIKLPDATLGAAAKDLRYNAYQAKVQAYIKLLDYADVVKTYKAMIKLRPKDHQLVLGLGLNQANAGQNAAAVATLQQYLQLEPHSQYAKDIKAAILKLKAATASPSPSTSP